MYYFEKDMKQLEKYRKIKCIKRTFIVYQLKFLVQT